MQEQLAAKPKVSVAVAQAQRALHDLQSFSALEHLPMSKQWASFGDSASKGGAGGGLSEGFNGFGAGNTTGHWESFGN